jgi:hypothetical protein
LSPPKLMLKLDWHHGGAGKRMLWEMTRSLGGINIFLEGVGLFSLDQFLGSKAVCILSLWYTPTAILLCTMSCEYKALALSFSLCLCLCLSLCLR